MAINIAEVEVPPSSAFAGRALKDLNIRHSTGANIVRIIRGGININIPGGNHRLYPGDRIIIAGTETDLSLFQKMLDTSIATSDDNVPSPSNSIVLDNYTITPASPLCGKSIRDTRIREQGECVIIGVATPSNTFVTNPDPNIILRPDDVIIVAGEQQKIEAFFG